MSAVLEAERLRDRMVRKNAQLTAIRAARAVGTINFDRFVADSEAAESSVAAELEQLAIRLLEVDAAAEEEQRLAAIADAQRELDELLEVERREVARRARVDELRSHLGSLSDDAKAQP